MAKKKTQSGSNTNAAILNYVTRYEDLNARKADLGEDVKQLTQEIKAEGFDASIIKELVKLRKNEAAAREKAQLLATYAAAIQLDLWGDVQAEAA